MKNYSTKSAPVLTPDQQQLITPDLMNYATAQAMKYSQCCVGILQKEDLQQEALYGLCCAAALYQSDGRATLKTFATYYIRKYVLLAVRDFGRPVGLTCEDREMLRVLSLDVPPEGSERDEPLGAALEIPEEDDRFADGLTVEEARETLEELLAGLTKQERKIVSLVHGLGGEPLEMPEVARVMNIKPGRAKQVYDRAISKMQLAYDSEE